MKINTYKNQKEIEKTFEVKNYDLMYGTVQDILDVMDSGLIESNDEEGLIMLIMKNRDKIEALLLDIFEPAGMVKNDLRNIKVKELVPLFIELFNYVSAAFEEKN